MLLSRVAFPGLHRAYSRARTLGVAEHGDPELLAPPDLAETAKHTEIVLFCSPLEIRAAAAAISACR